MHLLVEEAVLKSDHPLDSTRELFFFEESLKILVHLTRFRLHWVFVTACRLSLVPASWGCALVAVLRLLIEAAFVARALGTQASGLQ